MIEGNKKEGFYLSCDACGREHFFNPFEDFYAVVDAKKDDGWVSVKHRISEEWSEVCPECAEDVALIRRLKGVTRRGLD